jgi:hypothetical protein
MIRVEPFLELIFQNIDKLVADLSDDKRRRTILALRRVRDNMIRLQDRYMALLATEHGPSTTLTNRQCESVDTLGNWQFEFVDTTEAFHQQVYSTVSTLIHVLNYIGIPGVDAQHPSRSVQKFLGFLSELPQFNDKFHEDIDAVLRSIRFRAEYIDHPQGSPACDWMTYNYSGTVYLIYFVPKSDTPEVAVGDIRRGDPNAPDFSPPVVCDQFYVSPMPDRVFEGVIALVGVLLYRE